VPVTVGNIIGGGGLVGAVYWFIYLRASGKSSPAEGA
jgi:formate transporter